MQASIIGSAMADDIAHRHATRRCAIVEPVRRSEPSDTAHFVISRVARSCCHPGLSGPLAAGVLPEPELQHDEPPQAMPMVASTVAMLAPERRDGAVIEHAAIAQLAVEQQRVHHWRKRTAQP